MCKYIFASALRLTTGSPCIVAAINAGLYNNAVQNVPNDEVTFRFGFGESLLRSACLSPRCVVLAFVHLVPSAGVVIIVDHVQNHPSTTRFPSRRARSLR